MRKLLMAVAAAVVIVSAPSGAAFADETGIAVIHSWMKIGRKTCFVDHYHYGSGSGPTQAHARAAAVRSWIWPTALEYGSSWGDYRLAAGRTMKCTRSGPLWTCDTQARACRPY